MSCPTYCRSLPAISGCISGSDSHSGPYHVQVPFLLQNQLSVRAVWGYTIHVYPACLSPCIPTALKTYRHTDLLATCNSRSANCDVRTHTRLSSDLGLCAGHTRYILPSLKFKSSSTNLLKTLRKQEFSGKTDMTNRTHPCTHIVHDKDFPSRSVVTFLGNLRYEAVALSMGTIVPHFNHLTSTQLCCLTQLHDIKHFCLCMRHHLICYTYVTHSSTVDDMTCSVNSSSS